MMAATAFNRKGGLDMKKALLSFATCLSLLIVGLAGSKTPVRAAVSAAVSALVAHEKAIGNTDVEQPACYILQSWAQCSYGTGHGNAEVTAYLHLSGGKWLFSGTEGGVTFASMMEKKYGIPAPIAKKFQAKTCPNCPIQ